MGNPFFGGIGNMGMRPFGQPSYVTPSVTVPPVVPPATTHTYNAYAPMAPVNNTMNTIQTITPQSNLIWIDSPDEIPNYPSGRGWQQWFGDKNSAKLYIRETDSNGVIQPLSTVWITNKDPNAAPAEQQTADTSENQKIANQNEQMVSNPVKSDSPTREEFNILVQATTDTRTSLNELTKAVSALSGKVDEFLK